MWKLKKPERALLSLTFSSSLPESNQARLQRPGRQISAGLPSRPAVISGAASSIPMPPSALSSKAKADAFRHLPYDILHQVSPLLDDAEPAFPLLRCLDCPAPPAGQWPVLAEPSQARELLLWLTEMEVLMEESGLKKPWELVSLNYRRRAWDVCGVIEEMYIKMVAERKRIGSDGVMAALKAMEWFDDD
ncbi:hypothetical protein VTK26DRAFT_2963 [Humicola hyalothermophila]